MTSKQAIANIIHGKNIPYKHYTITTLMSMANKLERIEQIAKRDCCFSDEYYRVIKDIRNILEQE